LIFDMYIYIYISVYKTWQTGALHIYIYIFDNGGRLKTKLYDKRVDFSFWIVNFPFISSNIPVSPTYEVHITHLIRYSSDFLDRARLLTQRLFKQGYVATRSKSSLQTLYSRHHNLVGGYKISISQMTMDFLLFTHMFSFLYHC